LEIGGKGLLKRSVDILKEHGIDDIAVVVGYRGFGGKDAPEHLVMGEHGEQLLKQIGISTWVPEADSLEESILAADSEMQRTGLPAALFIRKGVLR